MLENLALGLQSVFELGNLLAIVAGVAIGITIGALPGLSVTMGLALMLPFTFGMDPAAGMLLLLGVYCGGVYGGSITAILLRTPGTAASAATVEDGFALAQQGRAGIALNMGIYASVFGGLFSGIILLLVAPQMAKFALKFGPPEIFTLALFGLTIIAAVSSQSVKKGLVMGALGILVGTIGLDPIDGLSRFTFKYEPLTGGIELVPALIGLFAIAEIFNQIENRYKSIAVDSGMNNEKFGFRQLIPFRKTLAKSSTIGVIVGAIPGTGGAIAAFLAYGEAQRSSKTPKEYGKGSLDGIAASESANNGTTGATLIPLLTLGIPGDVATAVLLGGLLIQGLRPGPELFTNHAHIVYPVLVGFIVVNIVMFIQAKLAIKLFARITRVPSFVLLPIVLALCLVGAFAVNNALYSVGIALLFGVIGYILPKYGYPVTPMLIAMILGPIAEIALRQSLSLSSGSIAILFQRPISIVFLLLTVISITLPFLQKKWEAKVSKSTL